MTISRLQSTIGYYRAQLARHETNAESILNAAHKRTLATLQPHLDKITKQIADKKASGDKVPVSWLYEQNRLKTIKAQITGQIDHFAALAQTAVTQLQRTAVELGTQSAQDLLQATVSIGVDYSFVLPPPSAIASIVGANQKGSPLADLFNGFGTEASDKAGQALVLGITLGENPRRIAGMIQNALGISRNRVLTIARTEMLRAYRQSALMNYRANSAVVEQWMWNCSKSPRTCAACLSEDGSVHDLDEEMESHPNCRCSAIPVTKSWSDILSDTGIDTSDIEDINFDDMQTGSEWFDEQDESVQRQILGDARHNLYADGTPLSAFVGRSYSSDWGKSIYVKSAKDVN
jgi:SPP1 gp7 family putative phage head morphogenesis protein